MFLTTILKGANIFCWLISLLKRKVTGKFVLSWFSSSASSPQFSLLDIFLGKVLSFFTWYLSQVSGPRGAPFFFAWYLSQVGPGTVFLLCVLGPIHCVIAEDQKRVGSIWMALYILWPNIETTTLIAKETCEVLFWRECPRVISNQNLYNFSFLGSGAEHCS